MNVLILSIKMLSFGISVHNFTVFRVMHFVKRSHATAKENELPPDGPLGSVAYMQT